MEATIRIRSTMVQVFPCTINVELATLILHWIVFFGLVKRHYNVTVHFACHLGKLLIQTCVKRIHIKSTKVISV